MDTRSRDRAKDCELGSTDWTTLGARISEAATIASAIHLQENIEAKHDAISSETHVMHRKGNHKTQPKGSGQRAWVNSENFIG